MLNKLKSLIGSKNYYDRNAALEMVNAFTLFISTIKVRMWPNGPPPTVERAFGPKEQSKLFEHSEEY
ncbi:hypothetical protein BB560_003754 [Smittium megazygosporum]|uniref:Uncharacterized protein n=1 Tax=Smittium megazygosporum TaxID=133381 RepID=A0A2T9ZB63_9FUNG|nr:hypothetical protein BB560_003754 [Smittium megazygosporum]